MELSFGSANAEICSCFLEPETHRQEWRDVACVLSRLQKKYECAEPCGVQSSERPSDLSQHKGVSRGAPTRLCPPHPAHRAAVELLWTHPLRRGSQHCSKLKAQVGPGMFLCDVPVAASPRRDAAVWDGKEQPLPFPQHGGVFKKAAAASWSLLGHLPEDAERVLCQPEG